MKKGIKVFLIILSICMVIIILDTIQAKVLNNKPLLSIKSKYDNVYKGIFVDYYNCNNEKSVTVFKGTKFNCIQIKKFVIVDESISCDQALELIFKNDYNEYYLPCIKSKDYYLKFKNGKKVKIKNALKDKLVTIEDVLEVSDEIIIYPKYEIEAIIKNKAHYDYKVNNYRVYYQNIKDVNLILNNKKISLKEALINKSISRFDLITKLNFNNAEFKKSSYDDGGSILYKGNKFNVMICNTLNGDRNIYFGNQNLSYVCK